jgi:hypothetical protein
LFTSFIAGILQMGGTNAPSVVNGMTDGGADGVHKKISHIILDLDGTLIDTGRWQLTDSGLSLRIKINALVLNSLRLKFLLLECKLAMKVWIYRTSEQQ